MIMMLMLTMEVMVILMVMMQVMRHLDVYNCLLLGAIFVAIVVRCGQVFEVLHEA
jgi:hypothetical protein